MTELHRKHNKHLFGILSIAARKASTRKWLKPDIPSQENWYDIIHDIFVMKELGYILREAPAESIFKNMGKVEEIYLPEGTFLCLILLYLLVLLFLFFFAAGKHPLFCLLFLLYKKGCSCV